jgi:hypothetical protein
MRMLAPDPPPSNAPSRDVVQYLDAVESRLFAFDRAIALADWALYIGRNTKGPERAQLARARFLASDSLLRFARASRARTDGSSTARRLRLLERTVLDALVEQSPGVVRRRSRLQRRIVAFRPRWRGRRVDRAVVYDALRFDPKRSDRRRAYLAEEPLRRSLEDELRSLIVERNERARSLGFASFFAMRLGFEGFTEDRLLELVDRALALAPSRIRRFRDESERTLRLEGWGPWDLLYARERRASLPDSAFAGRTMIRDVRAALRGWGFPSARLRAFRVVRHDLPFGGLTISPEIPNDVRVLVHSRGGWEYYLTLLHEFGHAIHAASIHAPSHLLRSADVGFAGYFEGIADLFEEIASDEAWLSTRPGVSASDAREFRAGRADESLIRATSMALSTRAELDRYRRPDRDPFDAHRRRVRRLFGYDDYPRTSIADPFFVTHPVYVQSYFLSLLFRKQVLRVLPLGREGALWPNRRAGPWLVDRWFRHGSMYDWVPRVRKVTGRPLDARAFASSVRRHEP